MVAAQMQTEEFAQQKSQRHYVTMNLSDDVKKAAWIQGHKTSAPCLISHSVMCPTACIHHVFVGGG